MENSYSSLRQIDHHDDEFVRLYHNCEPDDYPAHWHSSVEIIMPVENSYSVFISDHVYDLRPGEVLIIPGGTIHELFAPEEGSRYFFLVDQSQFYNVEGIAAIQQCFYPCVHLREETDGEMLEEARGYLRNAIREHGEADYFARSAMRLWVELFFAITGRYLLAQEERRGDVVDPHHHQTASVFLGACRYIADHCREKLTLQDVADYSGYSKFYFARMFKAYSGVSFYTFYLRQRVLLCERLLSDPSLSVTEVAIRSGFGSIATFNRIFKQHKGMTPSEFRRRHQTMDASEAQ